MTADEYEYLIQRFTVEKGDWCCWVSYGGRIKHEIVNCTSASDSLAKAMLWAESSADKTVP